MMPGSKKIDLSKNKFARHNKTNQRKDRRNECKDRDRRITSIIGRSRSFSRLLTNLIDNSIKFRKPGEDPVVKIKHTKINELKNVPVPFDRNALHDHYSY